MRSHAVAAGLALASLALPAAAQDWPAAQPVRLVVPFAKGGTTDTIARLVAPRIGESLNQLILVDNQPGQNGAAGTALVAKSPPDGYTLAVVFDSHMGNHVARSNLPFDALRDFEPVMLIGRSPYVLATSSEAFSSLADVVNIARTRPDRVSIAIGEPGSTSALVQMMLENVTKARFVGIPHVSANTAWKDLIDGNVHLVVFAAFGLPTNDRKVRVLASASEKRAARFPSVPTAAEQGLPDVVAYAWWAVVAPAGTPRAIVDRLNRELTKALNTPEAKDLSERYSMEGEVARSPEDLQNFLVRESEKWGAVVKAKR
jgi:tripartite-type tricarboxylate transporter receptor subunit TctC